MKETFKIELLKLAIEILKADKKELTAERVLFIYRQLIFGTNMPSGI